MTQAQRDRMLALITGKYKSLTESQHAIRKMCAIVNEPDLAMTNRKLINRLRKLYRMIGRGEIQKACELIDRIIEEVTRG